MILEVGCLDQEVVILGISPHLSHSGSVVFKLGISDIPINLIQQIKSQTF